MKNYLIGWQRFETTFEGDKISMELLPLRRGEFLRLLPILDKYYKLGRKILSEDDPDANIEQAEQTGEMIERIQDIVVGHVRNIRGFLINGVEPAVNDVFDAAVFMPLVAEIVSRLVEISKVEKEGEKNSEGQSTNPP